MCGSTYVCKTCTTVWIELDNIIREWDVIIFLIPPSYYCFGYGIAMKTTTDDPNTIDITVLNHDQFVLVLYEKNKLISQSVSQSVSKWIKYKQQWFDTVIAIIDMNQKKSKI